jgi:hypothetical protein
VRRSWLPIHTIPRGRLASPRRTKSTTCADRARIRGAGQVELAGAPPRRLGQRCTSLCIADLPAGQVATWADRSGFAAWPAGLTTRGDRDQKVFNPSGSCTARWRPRIPRSGLHRVADIDLPGRCSACHGAPSYSAPGRTTKDSGTQRARNRARRERTLGRADERFELRRWIESTTCLGESGVGNTGDGGGVRVP